MLPIGRVRREATGVLIGALSTARRELLCQLEPNRQPAAFPRVERDPVHCLEDTLTRCDASTVFKSTYLGRYWGVCCCLHGRTLFSAHKHGFQLEIVMAVVAAVGGSHAGFPTPLFNHGAAFRDWILVKAAASLTV